MRSSGLLGAMVVGFCDEVGEEVGGARQKRRLCSGAMQLPSCGAWAASIGLELTSSAILKYCFVLFSSPCFIHGISTVLYFS